ncbi:MAG: HAMP domain-containing histidine kinase [Firmicutes bacterium]|nr:HAMP domain-containing histidine kinase [Bacillota bacterium]
MKTSIRSRLFLITYGIILSFIFGLIILNNTYLESYYINSREKTLIVAFNEVKEVDLTSSNLPALVLDIESNYNLSIHILKEVDVSLNESVPNNGFGTLPPPYERLYGNQFSIHDGMIANIMLDFSQQVDGTAEILVDPIQVSSDDSYFAYMEEIIPNQNGDNLDFQMLGLFVSYEGTDGLNIYYILTVTFQSIQDSIDVFNSFTIIVGFIFMILSGFIMYFASYRFTTPILQINQVAQDLANLDFSKRVENVSNDEIGDLGKSINKMSAQLEASIIDLKSANEKLSKDIQLKTQIENMRKEFIASASHELKTPISLILGYSEALKLPSLNQETIDDYLNIIIDESNKMNKLVMALLKISQLESGFTELVPSKFSIKDLVDETIRLYSIKFDEQNIKVQINVSDVLIETDYDQLQTVLSNFIGNALHHIDDSRIIKIFSSTDNSAIVTINVFNSGTHIPDSELEHIWDSFYKVDKARTRSYGGQGLGLSIVRTTLQNLGLNFGVKNIEDGVLFYFTANIIK